MRAVFRQFLFDSEIAFMPRLLGGRNNRREECSAIDLLTNLSSGRVAADEPALLIAPHGYTTRTQRLRDSRAGCRVLTRIPGDKVNPPTSAQAKHASFRLAWGHVIKRFMSWWSCLSPAPIT